MGKKSEWSNYTDEELLDEIKKLSTRLGKTPSLNDLGCKNEIFSGTFIKIRFNCNWSDILILAGFSKNIEHYSEKDIKFLEENYLYLSDKDLAEKINKTECAIKSKRAKLGLLRQEGSYPIDEDDKMNIINDYISGEQIKKIAKKYNRNESTIIMNLKNWDVFEYKHNTWTEDEIKILKDIYAYGEWNDILNSIPNHTKGTIMCKASDLNLVKQNYRWSENEINVLNEAYSKGLKPKQIEKLFDNKISKEEIYTKASKLKITIDREWKDWEIEFVKNNYGKITVCEMTKTLTNRKVENIISKANEMGLVSVLKNSLGKGWSTEEDDFIKENYLKLTDHEMIKCLEGRTWRSIKWRREKLGLERPTTNGYGQGCINEDGIVFHSRDEMMVHDFIKSHSIFKYIKNIGTNHSKKGQYVFKLDDTWEYNKFYPDYVIEYIEINGKKKKLKKPIVIEYYGMARFDRKDNEIINNYNKKTLAKEKFYKSREDIYYIGLYPEDLKNNFQGVREKLTSFFMSNFKIDINKVA